MMHKKELNIGNFGEFWMCVVPTEMGQFAAMKMVDFTIYFRQENNSLFEFSITPPST